MDNKQYRPGMNESVKNGESTAYFGLLSD